MEGIPEVPDPLAACAVLDEACAAGLWEVPAAWLAGLAAALVPACAC